jgi:glycine cleavage system H protein
MIIIFQNSQFPLHFLKHPSDLELLSDTILGTNGKSITFAKTRKKMSVPDNLKYSNDHEWVKIEEDIAVIGITDFAQSELGDIVYIEIESQGEIIKKDSVFGTIEAVKTVSDLIMPLTGEILDANTALEETPEAINNDPYESGWIIKIKIQDTNQVKDLLDSKDYLKVIGE